MTKKGDFAGFLATPEPPNLGPEVRQGVQSEEALNQSFDQLFRGSKISSRIQQLIRALILLWHDHLESAHVLAQEIDNADGAFVHGIMHRREPDYGNAKYWFHRVGKHSAFPSIAARAQSLAKSGSEDLLPGKIVPSGEWDPFAFIDACEESRGASDSIVQYLREVQRIETESLLETFLR